ncbi:DUF1570 domain-containing protein [Botrimarina hoheduenensis]|uniref:DUF1570 domain-containing protein n=1 Tax=Botrimarina hoheduenensis TaxID=2528000 RepID=A0A5C5W9W2_9BACT|nr:DUF1570 domain-containing protein [Botrimarina hoheduenensis]TWT47656.1 hypothetical protein Pla111_12740 [Botrimarina hoheduenensis]
MLRTLLLTSAALCGGLPFACGQGAEFMFSAIVDGVAYEGRPLAWTKATVALLNRDGQLHEFAAARAKEAQKTAANFQGYSTAEMRQRLYNEFGSDYDYTSTQHYVVVHPRGGKEVWAERFEQMYRSFTRYFRVRGFDPAAPPYPLVAVVFRNRSEYQRYGKESKSGAPSGALGHYESLSNRVYLYDQSSVGEDRWEETAATVIHEATHQTAYNVGVHNRFAASPRWVSEGLATMFEARGVHDSRSYDRGDDRINRGRLMDFREVVLPTKALGDLASFIASDQAFERKPIPAYAQAWALTFFLSETRPQDYAAYLTRTADRPLFAEYPAAERVADFRRVFGTDLTQLEAAFQSYLAGLR